MSEDLITALVAVVLVAIAFSVDRYKQGPPTP